MYLNLAAETSTVRTYLSKIVKEAIRHSDRTVVFVSFTIGKKTIKQIYVREGDQVYKPCGPEVNDIVSFISNAVATGDLVYSRKLKKRRLAIDYITNATTYGQMLYLYEIIHVENRRLRKTTIVVYIYEFNVQTLKTWCKVLKRLVYILN